jgi:hypothetical protein
VYIHGLEIDVIYNYESVYIEYIRNMDTRSEMGDIDTQDVNNQLYEALRIRGINQQQQAMSVLNDNAMIQSNIRHQRDTANEAPLVVNAAVNYATNHTYTRINSGAHASIRLTANTRPLNPDECDVYNELTKNCAGSIMYPALNHHIDEDGEASGFRFVCNRNDSASSLPIHRKMFFRHSMLECKHKNVNGESNGKVLDLLMNQSKTLQQLTEFVQELHRKSKGEFFL